MKHIFISVVYIVCFVPYVYMLLVPGAGDTGGFGEALTLQLLLFLLLVLSFIQVIINLTVAKRSPKRGVTYGVSTILSILIALVVSIFSYNIPRVRAKTLLVEP